MSEADLRILVKKRGQHKSQLTRFVSYVNTLPEVLDNKAIIGLKTRLNKLESVYDHFQNVQSSLEIMDDSDEHMSERESFENQYYDIIAIANDKFTSPSTTTEISPNVSSHFLENNINVKLPQISMPEFNGSYDRWLQFHDCFSALIHNNSTLTNVQKFCYLQSALKGEASCVIRALEVSDANYSIAWNMLKERYENKRIIIHSHVKNLFELTSLVKESHTHLRKLVDGFVTHIRCLKNLGQPVDHWDTLLIYLISNKLDSVTRKEWESSIKNCIPTTKEFISFLTNKCLLLETMENKINTMSSSSKTFSKSEKRSDKSFSHVVSQNDLCLLCKGTHSLFYCRKLLNLSPKNRYTEIKKLNICTNCLRSGHFSNTCSASCCKSCGKRHNTILHFGSDTADNVQVPQQQTVSNADTTQVQVSSITEPSVSTHCTHSQNSLTLLQTAIIYILNSQGVRIKCRALLDSGSQANFITKDLFQKLNIDHKNVDIPIAGINSATMHVTSQTRATVQSVYNSYKYLLPFLIIDKITGNIPSISFGKSAINIPKNITLADPDFNKPGQIDILLGAGIFFDLLCVGQIKTGKNHPVLQKSKLGWIVAGPMCNFTDQSYHSCSSLLLTHSDIQSTLEKFWVIEECPPKANRSQEEIECEMHFADNLKRDSSGHFIVKLPLRANYTEIGESLQVATKRLLSVERKLNKDPIKKQQYHNFMREYINLGHMSQIDLENDHNDNIKYYLPHSSVSKTSSITTKLRVVFDASCKSDTGISLNDALKVGPVIQDDLFVILLRFRKHNYIITADITKMYRQVFIHKDHRDFQRIVWRFDTESDIQHFQLNTVTYGTASASFLATRALQQAAFDCQTSHPEACRVILCDFYVDDLISGSHDIESTIQLKTDISQILSKSGFPLRKWSSNNEQILESNLNSENSTSEYYTIESTETKILGISWDTKQDSLRYTVISDEFENQKVTKRFILSVISRIFDPLGLLGPIIVKAKLILQQLWQLKLNWDESVPIELHTAWLSFQNQILKLNHLKIPRQVVLFNASKFQIHGFSDSSQYAYGCAIYIRSENADGDISVNLLCAKSRVAPLKTITIPKLELCGAFLLAQLVNKVSASFTADSSDIFYWTDSTICLAWISSQPNTLKTFVANRVSDIQQLSDSSQWRHVSSEDNAADIITRGLNPDQLNNSNLWWHGPSFLLSESQFWPKSWDNYVSEIPEKRNITHSFTCAVEQTIFDKFSSFSKLQRVTAYCLRFINNTKNHLPKKTGELTPEELNNSIIVLSKIAQQSSFTADIRSLKRTGTVSSNSKLLSLAPFLDENNVIRVGGRLRNSQLEYNQVHPIVLPSKHNLTKLLIRHEHLKNLHSGAQFILANIRKRFWPLNGRGTVRSVLRQCVTCFRARPSNILPQMGNLPKARVTPARPFQKCGLDYAGPIMIKDGKLRNRAFVKAYLCIFVCFVTKATHIEVVSDLTTKGFLNGFKRFVSRRGLCEHIYSDNATNFVGAKNELDKISSDSLLQDDNFKIYLSENHITWHFIPPKSPHFGGLWEAAVKSAKSHLLRIVGDTTLTYESLCTVVVQIEAILNSRPLYPMSNDPSDLLPLTPGHFLIGATMNALPQSNVQDASTNRISHYHQLQQMVQHFWTRWSTEYLNTLQQRSKWKVNKASKLILGALVLLKEDKTAPMQWKLGRIVELHPGADQTVRVVSVKTSAGIFKRSVHKICLLPIET